MTTHGSPNIFIRMIRAGWLILTILLACITVLSGYGGMVNPDISTIPAILAMMFPVFLVATLVAAVVNLLTVRKFVWVQVVTLIVTASPWWHVCPLNFFHASTKGKSTFTLMSYNTFAFFDDERLYPNGTSRTASQLIASDADIICIQEAYALPKALKGSTYDLQNDSINKRYPYQVIEKGSFLSILSRLPLKKIRLDQPDSSSAGWLAAEAVIDGNTTLIVSLHLQSIGLDEEDKEAYRDLTKGHKEKQWKSTSRTLYSKLSRAFRLRAEQARQLHAQIDSLGYSNVIIAGDFNDISLCYAQRELQRGTVPMTSAYAAAGLGPTVTYHNNRFYFHIDHILYRGNFKAVRFKRGNIKSSDHYPITATFVLTDN